MTTRRLAAVDIGTVTTRLLVADVDVSERPMSFTEVERHTDITHLGQDLTSTGRLSADAMQRVRDVIAGYAERVTDLGVEAWAAVATSASRDAANGSEFLGMLQRAGIRPEIIAGAREAQLSFAGATYGSGAENVLVDDIGGGSTELVLGSDIEGDVVVYRAESIDVGSRRLTETMLAGDPPTEAQMADARTAADHAIAGYFASLERPVSDVVSVAGTATSLVAIELGLEPYDPTRVQGYRLGLDAIKAIRERLSRMTVDERSRVPGLHPGRASVIVAGTLILEAILESAKVDSTLVSERDILYGMLLELAGSSATGNVQVGGGDG